MARDLKAELKELQSLGGPGSSCEDFLWGLLASKAEIKGDKVVINLKGESHSIFADSGVSVSLKQAICEAVAHVISVNKLHLEDCNKERTYVTIP